MTQLAVVEFFQTTSMGQESLGTVTLTDQGVVGDPLPIRLLLGAPSIDLDTSEALEVFRDAPNRFDGAYLRASLVEFPFAEKHLPGKHDQKSHGRPGGGGPAPSPKEESGSLYADGREFQLIASYGNINGAKARAQKEGSGVEVVRFKGRYYVGKTARLIPTPSKPPEPKPKTPAPAPAGEVAERYRINPGTTKWAAQAMGGSATLKNKLIVEEALSELPTAHSGLVPKLVVSDKTYLPQDPTFPLRNAKGFKGRNIGGVADYNNKEIWVATGSFRSANETKFNTIHEVGHFVITGQSYYARNAPIKSVDPAWDEKRRAVAARFATRWATLKSEASPKNPLTLRMVSKYATTSLEEYQAESYAAYVRNPKLLKSVDMPTYDILKDLFDGQEY